MTVLDIYLGKYKSNPLVCFGINPSTATNLQDDKTWAIVQKIPKLNVQASKHGCDGAIMLNVYPLRATDPKNLPNHVENELHKVNLNHINDLFTELKLLNKPVMIWAAWGANFHRRKYFSHCLSDIINTIEKTGCEVKWLHRGTQCKCGRPHHPLFVSDTEDFKTFEIKKCVHLKQ